MQILVIGSALRSVSNAQAELGLTFLEHAATAPRYRLYAVAGGFAALVEATSGGISVPGELVEIPDDLLPEILASEPAGVTQSPVELADGRVVSAAVIDLTAAGPDVVEITDWGGFAAWWSEHRA